MATETTPRLADILRPGATLTVVENEHYLAHVGTAYTVVAHRPGRVDVIADHVLGSELGGSTWRAVPTDERSIEWGTDRGDPTITFPLPLFAADAKPRHITYRITPPPTAESAAA